MRYGAPTHAHQHNWTESATGFDIEAIKETADTRNCRARRYTQNEVLAASLGPGKEAMPTSFCTSSTKYDIRRTEALFLCNGGAQESGCAPLI